MRRPRIRSMMERVFKRALERAGARHKVASIASGRTGRHVEYRTYCCPRGLASSESSNTNTAPDDVTCATKRGFCTNHTKKACGKDCAQAHTHTLPHRYHQHSYKACVPTYVRSDITINTYSPYQWYVRVRACCPGSCCGHACTG